MPTADLFLSAQSFPAERTIRSPIPPFAAAFVLVSAWIERARQRKALGELDDHMLGDLGITRYDAAREADKPFWR